MCMRSSNSPSDRVTPLLASCNWDPVPPTNMTTVVETRVSMTPTEDSLLLQCARVTPVLRQASREAGCHSYPTTGERGVRVKRIRLALTARVSVYQDHGSRLPRPALPTP